LLRAVAYSDTEVYCHIAIKNLTNSPQWKKSKALRDYPTSQFKQRFLFSNLYGWENEYNFKIIWNFFATSHGKGAVDGIGGTVKRTVWRNVRTTAIAPNNALAYYELAKSLNMGITIQYVSTDTIKETCAPRLEVWQNSLVVINTMKLHCIKVRNSRQLEVAAFSTDETFKVENIMQITNGSDVESDTSLSETENDVENDELDTDNVIPDYYHYQH